MQIPAGNPRPGTASRDHHSPHGLARRRPGGSQVRPGRRLAASVTLAALLGAAVFSAPPAGPGGRFEDRLKEAERRARAEATPPRAEAQSKPVPAAGKPRTDDGIRTAKRPSRPTAPRAQSRATPVRTPRKLQKPVRIAARPAAPSRPASPPRRRAQTARPRVQAQAAPIRRPRTPRKPVAMAAQPKTPTRAASPSARNRAGAARPRVQARATPAPAPRSRQDENRRRAATRAAKARTRPARAPVQARATPIRTPRKPRKVVTAAARPRKPERTASLPVRSRTRPPAPRTQARATPVPAPRKPQKAVKTAARPAAPRAASTQARSRPAQARVQARATPERAPRKPRKTVTMAARPVSLPAPRRLPRRPAPKVAGWVETRRSVPEPPGRPAKSESIGVTSYSIGPRADNSASPAETGDLVLFSTSPDTMIAYTWEGGERYSRSTVILKGCRPGFMRLIAEAPALGGRVETRVLVKPGCITTVRFNFGAGRSASSSRTAIGRGERG